jgi:carbamoyltransferase
MGLAAYGDPSCRAEVEKLLALHDDGSFALNLQYFRHHKDDIAYEWHGGEPVCGPLFSQVLIDTLGPARNPDAPIEDRHRNLAFATQAVYEEGFFNLLNTLQRRNGNTAVALISPLLVFQMAYSGCCRAFQQNLELGYFDFGFRG